MRAGIIGFPGRQEDYRIKNNKYIPVIIKFIVSQSIAE